MDDEEEIFKQKNLVYTDRDGRRHELEPMPLPDWLSEEGEKGMKEKGKSNAEPRTDSDTRRP